MVEPPTKTAKDKCAIWSFLDIRVRISKLLLFSTTTYPPWISRTPKGNVIFPPIGFQGKVVFLVLSHPSFGPFAAPLHRLRKRIRQLRGTPGPCRREAWQKAPGCEQRTQVAAQSWDWQSLAEMRKNNQGIIGFLRGGVVIPLMFPKVPQSSRPESLGFPSYTPSPWTPPL